MYVLALFPGALSEGEPGKQWGSNRGLPSLRDYKRIHLYAIFMSLSCASTIVHCMHHDGDRSELVLLTQQNDLEFQVSEGSGANLHFRGGCVCEPAYRIWEVDLFPEYTIPVGLSVNQAMQKTSTC